MRRAGDWPDIFEQKQFWLDYMYVPAGGARAEYPEIDGLEVEFRLPEGYALSLLLTGLFEIRLSVAHAPERAPIMIGWDDEGMWHPHALRWEELEAICRCLAARDPRTPYLGISLLLLYRFAPITAEDDADAIRILIASAWRAIDLFSEDEIQYIIGETTWQKDLRWELHPEHGWVVAQAGDNAYSMRWSHNKEFPFALLRDLIQQARRCAGLDR